MGREFSATPTLSFFIVATLTLPRAATLGTLKLPDAELGTYPKGRVCVDCPTILSIYNPGPSCWVHICRDPNEPHPEDAEPDGDWSDS